MLWMLSLWLLGSPSAPAAAEGITCEADMLKQPMEKLALAVDKRAPGTEGKPCAEQLRIFAAIAQRAEGRLNTTVKDSPSDTADKLTPRLVLVALVFSALALVSGPVITIMLFRRYGLISWRLHVGNSTTQISAR
jgi:hypothetical protein